MAVAIRLRANTPPTNGARNGSAGAFMPVPVSTPMGATGRTISSRKTAVYGTVKVPLTDPSRDDDIESVVRRNTVRTYFCPSWSVLRPFSVSGLPRPPLAHPTTMAVGTSIGGPGGVAPQPRGRMIRRTGAGVGRVTRTPKPALRWPVQGKGVARSLPRKTGLQPTTSPISTHRGTLLVPTSGGPTERFVGKPLQRHGPLMRPAPQMAPQRQNVVPKGRTMRPVKAR